MKTGTWKIGLILCITVLLLWSCSGKGPASDFEAAKTAPATQAPAAAPAPAPLAPQVAPQAAAPTQRSVSARRTSPAKTAVPAPPPVQTAVETPLPPPTPAPVSTPVPVPVPQASAPVPVPAAPPEPTTRQITIPAGTQVFVRTIDPISSEGSQAGETYRASLDQPITVDNQPVVPRRADVDLKLVDVESAGKLKGTSELKVQLDKIYIDKKPYAVTSNVYSQSGSSSGQKAARNVGIGAAIGGVLGGVLGGGKGAVIGAGAGGGGGAAISKGEQIRIDSETALVFRLENPLDVTVTTKPASTSNSNPGGPAKLAPATQDTGAANVVGSWTLTTDNTRSPLQLILRQSGNSVDGTITNPMGGADLAVHGTLNNNYITFNTRPQSGAGNGAQMQFSGAVQGDTMQGTVSTTNTSSNVYGAGYPGGGYPGGGGGGGRSGRRGGGAAPARSTQANWNAQRID